MLQGVVGRHSGDHEDNLGAHCPEEEPVSGRMRQSSRQRNGDAAGAGAVPDPNLVEQG